MSNFYNILISTLLMSICFFPIVLISNYFYGLSHKILIFSISCLHIIGVGGLYFRKDIYTYSGWTAVKNFDFSIDLLLKYYYPLFIFLILLVTCIGILNFIIRLFKKKKLSFYKNSIFKLKNLVKNSLSLNKQNFNNSLLIFILSSIQLMASLIMFYSGKGIVGIVPETIMPYKIIGICYFISKMFVPIAISYLFLKSKFTNSLIIYVFIIALLSGSAQLSRSTFLITLLIPYVIILFYDDKIFLKIFLTFFIFYGIYHIGAARYLIHSNRNELGMVDISLFIYAWHILFFKTFLYTFDFSFWQLSINNVLSIFGRISSSQSIILANQFNLDLLGGALEQFKGIIFHKFQNLDSDLYNNLWMGISLPPGYATGGDILSKIITFWFYGKIYFILSAIYLAIWCKIIDSLCLKIKIRNELGTIFFNFLSSVVLLIWVGTYAFYIYFLSLLTITILLKIFSTFILKKINNNFRNQNIN